MGWSTTMKMDGQYHQLNDDATCLSRHQGYYANWYG